MRNGELMRAVSRFAMIGMIGSMAAACSSDRFASSGSFANPFSGGKGEPTRTGSINRTPSQGPTQYRGLETEPMSRVESSRVDAAPLAPPSSSAPRAPSYSPPPSSAGMPSRPRTASGTAGWSTAGGTTVIVGPGETLSTLTSRYGVPGEAILSANGLQAADVRAGRRVVIPVYSATQDGGARRVEAAPPAVRYNTPSAPVPARVVASRKLEVKKAAPRSLAEAAPPKSQLRPGKPVARAPEPVRQVAHAAPAPSLAPARVAAKVEPKVVAAAQPKPVAPPKAEPKVSAREVVLPAKKVARAEPAKPAPRAEPPQKVAAVSHKPAEPARVPSREPDATASIAPAAPVAAAAPASSSSDFRWPARGRVISGYGGSNEGINIAVPEGTAVKAAGDGVVAYAGSEVKGYGNLVLIRHDNGYVSAYANNGQIDVKRGQRVSRGQSIAKSGQTGNVTSPQLHFEIRKGSTPVDPMKYLASNE